VIKQRVAAIIGIIAQADDRSEKVFGLLRSLKVSINQLATSTIITRSWIEMLCRDWFIGHYAESFVPLDPSWPGLETLVDAVGLVLSTDCDLKTLVLQTEMPLEDSLERVSYTCKDLVLFICDDGHAGIAYPGVEVGDTVSVVLGCSLPAILRSYPRDTYSWEVVSATAVAGLMRGGAIYGDNFPPHWRAILRGEDDLDNAVTRIDGI